MGWIGGRRLDGLLGQTPCGCELVAKAAREADQRGARVLREAGLRAQDLWRCPDVTGREPTGDIDPRARVACRRVEQLLDAPAGTMATCPAWYAHAEWMHEACEATRGGMAAISSPPRGRSSRARVR